MEGGQVETFRQFFNKLTPFKAFNYPKIGIAIMSQNLQLKNIQFVSFYMCIDLNVRKGEIRCLFPQKQGFLSNHFLI